MSAPEPGELRTPLRERLALPRTTRRALRRAGAAAYAAASHILRLPISLSVLYALVAAGSLLTPAGSFVNERLFFDAVMAARVRFGAEPRLDDRVRILVVEDSSLETLKRIPTFDEWQRIASMLYDIGFERVLLTSFPRIGYEVGKPIAPDRRGKLFVGAVVPPGSSGKRSVDADSLDVRLMRPLEGAWAPQALPDAKRVLAPVPEVLAAADGIGTLNIVSNNAHSLGFAVAGHGLLPSLGLLAVKDLAWRDRGFVNALGAVPISDDGMLYVNYVDADSVAARSVAIRYLYDSSGTLYQSGLLPRVEERLKGGTVALLVPDGYTGSRFLASPRGQVPSYVSLASIVNSALTRKFLFRPIPAWVVFAIAAPITLALLLLPGTAMAVGSATALIGLWIAAGIYAILQPGWILPVPEIAIMAGLGCVVRGARHFFVTWHDKVNLSKDLALGSAVQSLLLPSQRDGAIGPWAYRIVFRPHGPMSGDWYQVYESSSPERGKVAVLAIGDVVGKGPSAALNTAVIACAWATVSRRWQDAEIKPEDLVSELQQAIYATFKGEQNSTLQLAVLTERDIKLMTFGAPAWHLLDGHGKVSIIKRRAENSLGVYMPEHHYGTHTAAPRPGDTYVAYTDGVMDGAPARRRFKEAVEASWVHEAPDVFAALEFAADAAGIPDVLPDDFTLLMIRCHANAASETDAA